MDSFPGLERIAREYVYEIDKLMGNEYHVACEEERSIDELRAQYVELQELLKHENDIFLDQMKASIQYDIIRLRQNKSKSESIKASYDSRAELLVEKELGQMKLVAIEQLLKKKWQVLPVLTSEAVEFRRVSDGLCLVRLSRTRAPSSAAGTTRLQNVGAQAGS
jgi:hypothetical protein